MEDDFCMNGGLAGGGGGDGFSMILKRECNLDPCMHSLRNRVLILRRTAALIEGRAQVVMRMMGSTCKYKEVSLRHLLLMSYGGTGTSR